MEKFAKVVTVNVIADDGTPWESTHESTAMIQAEPNSGLVYVHAGGSYVKYTWKDALALGIALLLAKRPASQSLPLVLSPKPKTSTSSTFFPMK